MAQEVVKGTGGGAQKGQGEAWCKGVCNKGGKEMREFRGDYSGILNSILRMIDMYGLENKELEGVIYLGRKEMRAIYSVPFGDISIDHDIKTGDIRLYGFPIIPVAMDTYAALAPSKHLIG